MNGISRLSEILTGGILIFSFGKQTNSIGRKDDHYTVKDLENIFYAQIPETQDHYAVRTMFAEATLQEFSAFSLGIYSEA